MMQNDVATCQQIGTELTRECSADVRVGLVKAARDFGPDTPAGRRCFNLDEMLQNRETATGQQLGNLNYWIGRQLDDLARLSSSGSKGERQ